MIEFKNSLETRILELSQSTDVLTYEDHLEDFQVTQLPAVIIVVQQDELDEAEDAPYGSHVWTAVLYYLDTTKAGETWTDGKLRRDRVVGTLHKEFEKNKFLADDSGPLHVTDTDGASEYVWLSQIPTITFDASGQEQYYTFVSEIHFSVHTGKNK